MDRQINRNQTRLRIDFLTFLLLLLCNSLIAQEPDAEQIVSQIIAKAKENESSAEKFGFQVENNQKKFKSDGTLKEEEKRTYRTTWIKDEIYLALIRVNGKELDAKHISEEKKRREKFIKNLQKKEDEDEDEEEDITWDELRQKYQYELLPSDSIGKYVLTFRPKSGKLQQKSRTEKLFNHLSGKIWADEVYNLIRAEARLDKKVKFGWGILAKIEELQLEFTQEAFENIWLPSTMFIRVRGEFALFKNERREIRNRYYEYFSRPSQSQASSQ